MKHYAEMSNEEFMNVAGDVASLEDDARIVIAGELSATHIAEGGESGVGDEAQTEAGEIVEG